jgi:hypothetical protein
MEGFNSPFFTQHIDNIHNESCILNEKI